MKLRSISQKNAFSGRLQTPGRLGAFTAGSISADGGTRALVEAESGIGSLVVLKGMTDCDVGVGLDGTASTTPARINLLYVGGNMLRSNVNAGVWWNDVMPYSDGAAPNAWLKRETAELGVVFVGLSLGNSEPGTWGIGSSGNIAYIGDSTGPILSFGVDNAEHDNCRIARNIA